MLRWKAPIQRSLDRGVGTKANDEGGQMRPNCKRFLQVPFKDGGGGVAKCPTGGGETNLKENRIESNR